MKYIKFLFIICLIMTITISSADSEKITNGGFETGTLSGWTVVTGTGTVTIETPAPIGTYYSYLDSDFDSTTYIYQSVDLTNVDNLTFKYKADADFFEGSAATDVYIGAIKVASNLYSIAWDDKSIDVSTYSGVHTVKFLVELADNSEGYAYMDLDGISAIRSYNVSKPTDQTNLGNNLIDHTPTITWTKGASAEADTITTYIYVGTTSTPTAIEGFTTEETYDLGTNITLTDGNTYYYRLRSYNGTSYSSYTTADEFRMNPPPSVPTISSPSNNSYHTSQPITIQANSTDVDGGSLTYYFYGDTVDGSTLLGTSTNGTYVWHQALSGDYILKVRAYDGYEYSDYSNLVYFHSLIPPLLTTDLVTNGDFENWSGGPTSTPDDWTLYLGSIARSTIKKTGTYSAELTPAPDMQLYQTVSDPLQYRNTVMTLGVWIKTPTSSLVRISIKDDVGRTFSPYHTGSGNWEFLTVTRTIDASATYVRITPVHTSSADDIIYVDSAILVKGAYPYVSEPLNNSIHTFDFPPLLHDLTFTWQDSDADGYKYQIATDEKFNLISDEGSLSTYTTDVSLTAGDYFWRLFAYDPITNTYSDSSDVWKFTINETTISDGTAIDGVVYEITNAGSIAVEGALVNIWNTTWSDSMLVGQNGYYYFDGIDNSTYSLRATKTGYTDSAIELVTATSDATTTRNILLQSTSGAGQQYVDHYVKFIVKSLIGTLYSDVEVNVYLGDAVIPQYTGTTGTDGSISFELDENQEYRITFVKTSPSIDREITIYPKDDSYTVYVDIGTMIDDLLNPDDEDQAITAIDVSVTKTIINDDTANITVNFNDMMDETSGLTLTLSQSIAGNTTNRTILSTVDLGTTNNTAYNFTVTNYNGQSYFIEVTAAHTTHGAISRLYGIQFENTDTLFGFTVEVVGWLAIIFLTWFALTATSITVQHTAIGVCALATAMIAIGWGSYISMSGLGLAWIMSLAANFAHAKEASA